MPKVTVLMTVYNVEKYIRAAVFSILNQTFKDFEFLIINDGSTDDTEDIILSFKDDRIKYLKNDKNIGISNSLNKGIHLSNGKYIVRLDGDDICFPNRVERQVDFMDQHKDYGLAGSWYYVINNKGALQSVKRKATEHIDIALAMLFENQFIQSSTIMRTDLLKEMMYDPELKVCEDYDLFMRILYRSKVANIPEELITYRWYGGNTSIINQKEILTSFVKIFSKTLDHYHISHTKEELFLHSVLTFRYTKKYFNTNERINVLDHWLEKIGTSPEIVNMFGKKRIQAKLENMRKRALITKKEVVSF